MLTWRRAFFWLTVGLLAITLGAVAGRLLFPDTGPGDRTRRIAVALVVIATLVIGGLLDRALHDPPDDED